MPYPDNGDLPRAWALLWCHDFSPEYPNCYPLGDLPQVFTDTVAAGTFLEEIVQTDSMIFYGPPDTYLLDYPAFGILPYGAFEFVNIINHHPINYKISPNPFYSSIKIGSKIVMHDILIYDIAGKLVKSINNISADNLDLDLRDLHSNQMYIIKIITDNTIYASKIIKH